MNSLINNFKMLNLRSLYIVVVAILSLTNCNNSKTNLERKVAHVKHQISALNLSISLPLNYVRLTKDAKDKKILIEKLSKSVDPLLLNQLEQFINQSMPNWTQFLDTLNKNSLLAIYPMNYTIINEMNAKEIGKSLKSMTEKQNETSELKAKVSEISTGKTNALRYIKYKVKYSSSGLEYNNFSYILTKGKKSYTFQIMTKSENNFNELIQGIK